MAIITPVSGAPDPTTHQVGATVYIPYSRTANAPQAAVVEKTETFVLDANEDGTSEETTYYYFVGQPSEFKLTGSLVFATPELLEAYLDSIIDGI